MEIPPFDFTPAFLYNEIYLWDGKTFMERGTENASDY